MKLFSHWGDRRWEIEVDREGDRLMVRCEGETLALRFDADGRALRNVLLDSRSMDFAWTRKGDAYRIVIDGASYQVTVRDLRSERIAAMQPRDAADPSDGAVIRAPIPGMIRRILVKAGDAIARGQPLLTLDAMKMENEICSPIDGTVGDVRAREGETVEKDEVLLHLAGPGS
jgi:biotin carboxyl carrier protein